MQCKCKITGGIFLFLIRQGAVAEEKIGINFVVEKPFWMGSATPACAPQSFVSSLLLPYPTRDSNTFLGWAVFTHIHVPEVFQVVFFESSSRRMEGLKAGR